MRSASEGLDEEQSAQAVWKILQARRERISKDGKPLMDEAENLAELRAQVKRFRGEKLNRWKEIGVNFDAQAQASTRGKSSAQPKSRTKK